MYEGLSGIEHAMIKRLALFKKHHVPAKIVTNLFNSDLHQNLKKHGLDDDDVINLFDYLQNAQHYDGPVTALDDLRIPDDAVAKQHDNMVDLWINEVRILSVELAEGTNQRVKTVRYYDQYQNQIQKDIYDSRGFLSLRRYYDQYHKVSNEEIFSISGKIVYHSAYRQLENGKLSNTSLQLVNFKRQTYEFNDMYQLTSFFYDQLNTGHDTYISDRDVTAAVPLVEMQTPANKFLFYHNIMTKTADDLDHGEIWQSNQYDLDHLDYFKGIIVSTNQQAEHIQQRFQLQKPVFTIPVGYVDDETVRIPMSQREQNSIICVARVDVQKRLDHLISAAAIVKQQVKDFKIKIFGVVRDAQLKERLQQQINDNHLENNVLFAGYTPDIAAEYDKSQLMASTSLYEGFNMSLLEAQKHGVPVVSYDIAYGPADIIDDQKSGYLIENGEISQLADKLVELLSNSDLLQKFSDASYESAQKFNQERVWQLWNQYMVNSENE